MPMRGSTRRDDDINDGVIATLMAEVTTRLLTCPLSRRSLDSLVSARPTHCKVIAAMLPCRHRHAAANFVHRSHCAVTSRKR